MYFRHNKVYDDSDMIVFFMVLEREIRVCLKSLFVALSFPKLGIGVYICQNGP